MELKRKSKIVSIIIGIILLVAVIIFNLYNYSSSKKEVIIEENKIEEFFVEEIIEEHQMTEIKPVTESKRQNTTNYSMIVEIPNIGLKKGLCSIGQECNTVSKNIQILKESDMPNVTNGNLLLAGHNGNSKVSFFNKLDKLKVNDSIYIYYNGTKYEYKLSNYYDIKKTGKAIIHRDNDKTTLVLITCKKNTDDKQVVYIAYLDNKTEY